MKLDHSQHILTFFCDLLFLGDILQIRLLLLILTKPFLPWAKQMSSSARQGDFYLQKNLPFSRADNTNKAGKHMQYFLYVVWVFFSCGMSKWQDSLFPCGTRVAGPEYFRYITFIAFYIELLWRKKYFCENSKSKYFRSFKNPPLGHKENLKKTNKSALLRATYHSHWERGPFTERRLSNIYVDFQGKR